MAEEGVSAVCAERFVELGGGLVIGGLAGLIASTAGGGTAQTLIGESSGGVILSAALLGAAAGLFVGSFLGLSDRTR